MDAPIVRPEPAARPNTLEEAAVAIAEYHKGGPYIIMTTEFTIDLIERVVDLEAKIRKLSEPARGANTYSSRA